MRKAQETVLQRAGKCKVIIVLSADATYSTKNEKELIKVAKQVFSKYVLLYKCNLSVSFSCI